MNKIETFIFYMLICGIALISLYLLISKLISNFLNSSSILFFTSLLKKYVFIELKILTIFAKKICIGDFEPNSDRYRKPKNPQAEA